MEQHVQQAGDTDVKAAVEAYIKIGEHRNRYRGRRAAGLEIVQKIQEKDVSFLLKLNDDNRLTVVIFFHTPLPLPTKSIDRILVILMTGSQQQISIRKQS